MPKLTQPHKPPQNRKYATRAKELRNPEIVKQRLPACPPPQGTKLLLHPDFLNIVTSRVQRAEIAHNCHAASTCGMGRLQRRDAGPQCTGKRCCCLVFWEGGLWPPSNMVSLRLQHADSVYNWQAVSTCGAQCLQLAGCVYLWCTVSTNHRPRDPDEWVSAVLSALLVCTNPISPWLQYTQRMSLYTNAL